MSSYSVLHVAETLKGGIASYLNEIIAAQALAAPRNGILLLVPDDQVQELRLPATVQLVTFSGRGARIGRTVDIIAKLRQIVPMLRPDIIHAHSSFAGIAVRSAVRIFRLPALVVYCAHGWAFDRAGSAWKNALIAKFEALLARCSDAVVCISLHDYRSAQDWHLPAEKLVLIPNAIARESVVGELPEWPAQRRRFVFVGRLDRQKGADIFIAAMRRLGADGFAYLVGAGVVGAETMPELPSNVVATGWLAREQVQAYLQSADVVVVPSRWEGFGLIALEAMRAAKPIIASRVGGLVELVSDGVTGRLVAPGNVDELESALRAACAHDWTAWGEAGRARFLQSYTAERLQRQLAELYEKLLAGEWSAVAEQRT